MIELNRYSNDDLIKIYEKLKSIKELFSSEFWEDNTTIFEEAVFNIAIENIVKELEIKTKPKRTRRTEP